MKEKHIWPPSALQWVTLIAIIYFTAVALAFYETEPCNGAGGFYAALRCLEANELGDLLAGLFAPLAFIGLGYAIYVQSQELKAQRQELRETRLVSEANVGFIGRQTTIAERSAEADQEARRSRIFQNNALFAKELIESLLSNGLPSIQFESGFIYNDRQVYIGGPVSVQTFLNRASRHIDGYLDGIGIAASGDGEIVDFSIDTATLVSAHDLLGSLSTTFARLDSETSAAYRIVDFETLRNNLDRLRRLIPEYQSDQY